MTNSLRFSASNPKLWIVIGVGVAGIIVIAAEAHRRRRRRTRDEVVEREDFGAFVKRFELIPLPQPLPPAARLPLTGLTFAVKDIFEVQGEVTGFGNPDWERTHEEAEKTAEVIMSLLKNGATCVGVTVLDELSLGITGENVHHGTPVNPQMPSNNPGGSSSGSAVAVAAKLVDFALGTDSIGCVRIPAAYCGVLGYRPSHGAVSVTGVLPNCQSLDTVGWFARNPSILNRVGHVLLKLNSVAPRRARRILFAEDLFEFSILPKQRMLHVLSKVVKNLSGY
ncbi:Outer envelope protein 64, mitochondrial-like protein [Drosera capensis]